MLGAASREASHRHFVTVFSCQTRCSHLALTLRASATDSRQQRSALLQLSLVDAEEAQLRQALEHFITKDSTMYADFTRALLDDLATCG